MELQQVSTGTWDPRNRNRFACQRGEFRRPELVPFVAEFWGPSPSEPAFFAEGALSPADDILDLAVAAVLVRLLGWHWEFLPAFAGELVPGVDLVPFWTLAVANVYRKWKQAVVTKEPRDKAKVIAGEYR
jgi:hypothetical protein